MTRNQLNLAFKHRDRLIETINMVEIWRLRGLDITISELQKELKKELQELDQDITATA